MSEVAARGVDTRGTAADFQLRIATAPVNWNNDDLPDWRVHTPFPRILDVMREAGYSATEFGANFPADPTSLQRALSERSMELCGAYQWLPLRAHSCLAQRLNELDATFATLQACGCNHLIIADELTPERVALAGHVPGDGSKSLDSHQYRDLAHGVAVTAEHADRFGLRTHVHNHVGTYVETPDEVAALAVEMDPGVADFCFDTGHYAYGSGDPVQFVQQYPHRIGYLHLKDVDAKVLAAAKMNAWSFLAALRQVIFCRFGEGVVDIPAIIDTLTQSSFDGWIVVEQDTCRGDSTEMAADNLAYLIDYCGSRRNATPSGVRQ
jgi:inosose dehydratase